MKTNRFALVVLSFVLLVSMVSCGGSQAQSTPKANPVLQVSPTPDMGGAEGVQYWQGTFPGTLIMTYQAYGKTVQLEISGIPFMVLSYDKISLKITTVVFGLSEVTHKLSSGVPDTFACLDASTFQGMGKLALKGCIYMVATSTQIANSVQQFSFVDALTLSEFVFVYTSDNMEGGVTNVGDSPLSMRSERNVFKLYRQ